MAKHEKKSPDKGHRQNDNKTLWRLNVHHVGWFLVPMLVYVYFSVYVFDQYKSPVNVGKDSSDNIITVVEQGASVTNQNHHQVYDHLEGADHEHNCFCQVRCSESKF